MSGDTTRGGLNDPRLHPKFDRPTCVHLTPDPTCTRCGWDTPTNRKAAMSKEPTARDLAYAKERRTMAYWYAVGMAAGARVPDVAPEFGDWMYRAALDYRLEERTSLPSVPDAYRMFTAAERVRLVYSSAAEDLDAVGRAALAEAVKALEGLRG